MKIRGEKLQNIIEWALGSYLNFTSDSIIQMRKQNQLFAFISKQGRNFIYLLSPTQIDFIEKWNNLLGAFNSSSSFNKCILYSPTLFTFSRKSLRMFLKATSCKYVIPCLLWKTHPRCLWYYFTRVIFFSLWVIISHQPELAFLFSKPNSAKQFWKTWYCVSVFEACFSLKVKSHLNSFYLTRKQWSSYEHKVSNRA